MIDENIIPRNLIINLGCASVDNHIPWDDIFDYHPIRECNIYIIYSLNIILILNLYVLTDSSLWFDTINLGQPVVCIEGHRL